MVMLKLSWNHGEKCFLRTFLKMVQSFYRISFFHILSNTNSFHYLIFLIGKPKCCAIFFLYVSPFFVINFLPDDYSAHFLLYYTYVKVLYFFTDRKQLAGIEGLFSLYYESLSTLYSKRSELATIHYHSHLFSQVYSHGALCFTSCFPRESYLSHALKWCKGKTHVLSQLVTWYEVSQNNQSSSSYTLSDIFSKETFSLSYVDNSFIISVHQSFFWLSTSIFRINVSLCILFSI